ncbi:MAG: spore cortex biosynthesis protein YabQ [Clostridia bacterium]|nr:spore cortex biosynthesis protein YabQ [Clostridia bacterium]
MQFLVISHQLWEILMALVLGLALGFCYDCIRFIRRLLSFLKIDVIIANIFDLVYLVLCACAYCVFVYWASSGHFRWFTALSVLLGAVLYRLIPSRAVSAAFRLLADAILWLLRLLLIPLRFVICALRRSAASVFVLSVRRARLKKTLKFKKMLRDEVKLS